ncbi:uncharacterized protein LOC124456361 [Xenia sp. Carnegie-2017]|uniref:uncharacterized protein LOC124456361 n=1 Tax=Xenia sp. Carnegie-2017 TaxID=2897299 RepID=UPI001F042DB9|nr:uncharacterized protein LOC124456361 [Xenia sp. Carnegie-2017]
MTRNILKKLKGIKAGLVRGNEGWQDWNLTNLISELKKWRDINPAEESGSSKKTRKPLLVAGSERRKRRCVYCNAENHSAVDCTVVTDIDKRKKLLAEKKLCFNCTGTKHRTADCKSSHRCSKCNGKHHSSICTKKDQLLTAGDGPAVYPTVVVSVEGIKCRALLDTGSGNSYVSAALLDLLPKRSYRKETRRVEMMLTSVTKEMELSTIRVKDVKGEFQMDVNITKVNKGELLFVDNPIYKALVRSYSHLAGVKIEDDDQKPKLPVHLILGATDYMRIKTSEKPRVGKVGEPVAEKTKFGWTILAQGKELDYAVMFLSQTSQSDYEELCRLDVLGLADKPKNDQHEVYAEFQEQLVRSEEGWYETGLPWKGNHPQLQSNYKGSLRRLANLQRRLHQKGLTNSYSEIIEQQKVGGIVEAAKHEA